MLLCYLLGVPLHSSPYPCPERCGRADSFEDHQVGCGGNGDCVSCQTAIWNVVFTATALAPSKETSGLETSSLSRPADILLPN